MGWAEIPEYFCATTKTGHKLIRQAIKRKFDLPHHVFMEYMLPEKEPKRSITEEAMYSILVYLDDLIVAAVENVSVALLV